MTAPTHGLPTPEKTRLSIGFIPLTDCAPLVVAKERGLFERYGLDVTLSREASWANIRDKVIYGALDGAQMLAAMPLAITLGLGGVQRPMNVNLALDLNGNAITLSEALWQRLRGVSPDVTTQGPMTAQALKKLVDEERRAGKAPLTLAMVFSYSTHNYQLRYWLASAGIHPDQDINLVVVPPPHMVDQLASGKIDGFCVGEPWNTLAVQKGVGRIAVTGYEIWNNSPEKVFGVTAAFAQQFPNTHLALSSALLEACAWLDAPEHRAEAAHWLSQREYVNAPEVAIGMSLSGRLLTAPDEAVRALPDFHVFYRYAANCPWRSHAVWLLTQMYRWGQISDVVNLRALAEQVYRPSIYRRAAQHLGLPAAVEDHKAEGHHESDWIQGDITLGADRFCDGAVFDPGHPHRYLDGFAINSLTVPVEQLRQAAGE